MSEQEKVQQNIYKIGSRVQWREFKYRNYTGLIQTLTENVNYIWVLWDSTKNHPRGVYLLNRISDIELI